MSDLDDAEALATIVGMLVASGFLLKLTSNIGSLSTEQAITLAFAAIWNIVVPSVGLILCIWFLLKVEPFVTAEF